MSDVQICNLALSHIGARSTISSLNEQSAEAQQCKAWYDIVRKDILQRHNWSFARRRLTMALIEQNPAPEWRYRYALPHDWIAVRYLEHPAGADADALPFDLEASLSGAEMTLLTNADAAKAIYTFDQTYTNMFSDKFRITLSWGLAAVLAVPITGDERRAQYAQQIYMTVLEQAMGSDAGQAISEPPREAEAIRARL